MFATLRMPRWVQVLACAWIGLIGTACRDSRATTPAVPAENEVFILPSGMSLGNYVLKGGHLEFSHLLTDFREEARRGTAGRADYNARWPAYDSRTGDIYFEAPNPPGRALREGTQRHSSRVFRVNAARPHDEPEHVVDGYSPSLSPDGQEIAFLRGARALWVIDVDTSRSRRLGGTAKSRSAVVWLSDRGLLFANADCEMVLLDTVDLRTTPTGHKGLEPSALSPDGGTVLCRGQNRKGILLYDVAKNEIRVLKKFSGLSIGPVFVWSRDGGKFLYTRQTTGGVLRFREGHQLFLRTLGGKETKLEGPAILFGGLSLGSLGDLGRRGRWPQDLQKSLDEAGSTGQVSSSRTGAAETP